MRKIVAVTIILLVAAVTEVILVPLDPVLASPPNTISKLTCPSQQPIRGARIPCTFTYYYFRGAGSLTYCLFGEGALYLGGVYYPLTQPKASLGRQIGNPLCPAMHA